MNDVRLVSNIIIVDSSLCFNFCKYYVPKCIETFSHYTLGIFLFLAFHTYISLRFFVKWK